VTYLNALKLLSLLIILGFLLTGCHQVKPPPVCPSLQMDERLISPTQYPEIPEGVAWGDFGGIIGLYDEALTSCNIDKAGISEIIDDFSKPINITE